jgi:NitT/TauT family transport system permease protein
MIKNAPTPSRVRPKSARFRKRRSVFWQVRGEIPSRLYYSLMLLSILVPTLIWSILTYGQLVNPLFLPSPTQVLQTGWTLLLNGQLLTDVFSSTSRILWGFFFSALLGVPIGLLIGSFKTMEGLLEPMLGLMRYMPAAAFIPLLILWLGLGESAKIAIIFLGTFFYNVLMVADAVKFVASDWIKVSYTLGATERDVFLKVIFPATLPNILDTLRVNIATAWNFVIVAELVAASSGLGYRILMAQRTLRTDEIFLGILLIGLIGLGIDLLFKSLTRLVVPWSIDQV